MTQKITNSDRLETVTSKTVPIDPVYRAQLLTLIKMLTQNPEIKVRKSAARSLGHFEDEAAIVGLVGALKDSAACVRQSAAAALATIGCRGEGVEAGLLEALQDSHIEVCSAASQALWSINTNDPRPPQLPAARTHVEFLMAIKVALLQAQDKDDRAVPILLQALSSHPDYYIRWDAARALKELTKHHKGLEEKLCPSVFKI